MHDANAIRVERRDQREIGSVKITLFLGDGITSVPAIPKYRGKFVLPFPKKGCDIKDSHRKPFIIIKGTRKKNTLCQRSPVDIDLGYTMHPYIKNTLFPGFYEKPPAEIARRRSDISRKIAVSLILLLRRYEER